MMALYASFQIIQNSGMDDVETTITMRCSKAKKTAFRAAQKLLGLKDLSSFMLLAAVEKAEAEHSKRGLKNPFLDLPEQQEVERESTAASPIQLDE